MLSMKRLHAIGNPMCNFQMQEYLNLIFLQPMARGIVHTQLQLKESPKTELQFTTHSSIVCNVGFFCLFFIFFVCTFGFEIAKGCPL